MKSTLFILLSSIIFLGCSSLNDASTTTTQPNIVYIFTDDLGYGDLACFGATDIKTPNLDKMAEAGMKFTSFYSASSVCSPSRAGLLTGRYPQRMGINGVFFPESFTGMPPSEITIPELLKEKGYATGMVGKWHLGHMHQYLPLQQGFDSYFGIPYSNDMESVVYMRGNEVASFDVDQRYTTKIYTEEAVKFIDNNRENPFFLFLSHNMPHVPIYASERFIGTSERGLYGDVIQELDWSVGQVLEKLEKLELLENTLVIFSSDNGPWLVMEDHGGSAGELREGKMFTFEGGMRVPTLAMWKGKITANSVYSSLASQMDWFPTIASISGIDLPSDRNIDGKDLSAVLSNEGKRGDDQYLFMNGRELQAYANNGWKVKLPFKGYPGSRWKKKVAAHDTLLFNLINDPGETENLFYKNKELGLSMIQEMWVSHANLGQLPPDLQLRSPADESHFEYLESKNN
ncbi:MAG: sulfatase [Reichenbachiella sp.]